MKEKIRDILVYRLEHKNIWTLIVGKFSEYIMRMCYTFFLNFIGRTIRIVLVKLETNLKMYLIEIYHIKISCRFCVYF